MRGDILHVVAGRRRRGSRRRNDGRHISPSSLCGLASSDRGGIGIAGGRMSGSRSSSTLGREIVAIDVGQGQLAAGVGLGLGGIVDDDDFLGQAVSIKSIPVGLAGATAFSRGSGIVGGRAGGGGGGHCGGRGCGCGRGRGRERRTGHDDGRRVVVLDMMSRRGRGGRLDGVVM